MVLRSITALIRLLYCKTSPYIPLSCYCPNFLDELSWKRLLRKSNSMETIKLSKPISQKRIQILHFSWFLPLSAEVLSKEKLVMYKTNREQTLDGNQDFAWKVMSCLIPKGNNSFFADNYPICTNVNWNSLSLFSLHIFLAVLKNVCRSFNSVLRVFSISLAQLAVM